MIRVCDKAGTRWCPDPLNCAMATAHECAHEDGQCHLGPGRWMRVRCVETKQEAGSTGQEAEQRRAAARVARRAAMEVANAEIDAARKEKDR